MEFSMHDVRIHIKQEEIKTQNNFQQTNLNATHKQMWKINSDDNNISYKLFVKIKRHKNAIKIVLNRESSTESYKGEYTFNEFILTKCFRINENIEEVLSSFILLIEKKQAKIVENNKNNNILVNTKNTKILKFEVEYLSQYLTCEFLLENEPSCIDYAIDGLYLGFNKTERKNKAVLDKLNIIKSKMLDINSLNKEILELNLKIGYDNNEVLEHLSESEFLNNDKKKILEDLLQENNANNAFLEELLTHV